MLHPMNYTFIGLVEQLNIIQSKKRAGPCSYSLNKKPFGLSKCIKFSGKG